MRLTQGFIPTIKETPNEAQIASHRLMLRAGLVRQTSAGIYAWLPLGLRVLRNIERIVREEQDACGALLLFVTFLSIIPAGLIAARLNHVSLRNVPAEAEDASKVPAEPAI